MNENRMSNRDFLNKYHDAEPYSFGGIKQVKNHFNVKSQKIARVLSKSDTYTTFREFKKPSKTPPIRTYGRIISGRLILCFLHTLILLAQMKVSSTF